MSRKGFCRNPGIFLNKVLGRGIFFVDFLGLFPWNKEEEKNPPIKSTANSNQSLGVSWPNSTLQGSGLEKVPVKFIKRPKRGYKLF